MEIRTKVHTILMLIGPTECGKTTFAERVLLPKLKLDTPERGLHGNVQLLSSDRIRQEMLGYEYDKYDSVMLEASEQTFALLFERLKLATTFPINAEFVIVDTTGLSEDFRQQVRAIAEENHYNVEAVVFDYRKRSDYYASERSKRLISTHINRLKKDVLPALAREGYDAVHRVKAKDFGLGGSAGPAAATGAGTVETAEATEAAEATGAAGTTGAVGISGSAGEAGSASSEVSSSSEESTGYTVVVENQESYVGCILPQGRGSIVIGDVHESVDALRGLLLDYGCTFEDGQLILPEKLADTDFILAGDWIDKGKRTRETIEFLHANRKHFLLVKGNHENFVYKYLRGEISGVDGELLDSYFDSIPVLEEDGALRAKFDELVEASRPFYRRIGVGEGQPSFYVTHAPCENKYIGKLGAYAQRHQRTFRLRPDLPKEEQLAFLRRDAVGNHPYHLFGHVAAKQAFRLKNKLHLDTGAVHGNLLTSVSMGYKPFFRSHKAANAAISEELHTLFVHQRRIQPRELSDEDLRRLRYISRHKINFVSGTMSPSDKDLGAGELESLRRGLDYFRGHGVREVVLQPKYMGSRCNLYLHRSPEESFAVSRNGYKIKSVDLTQIHAALIERFGSYMEEHGIRMLILDGELMPWHALGEGLIERQFRPIGEALKSELSFLREQGFEQALDRLTSDYEESGFGVDRIHSSKAKLNEKYGSGTYQTYKYVHDIRQARMPLDVHEEARAVYERQLGLYAQAGEAAYKPFGLLKIVYADGREELPGLTRKQSDLYAFLSDDSLLTLDLAADDAYERASAFFNELTSERGMEGVVIKPELPQGGVAPNMKVRNADYLSIVYGYDYRFPHKYAKLIKQKSIQRKLRTSIEEHRLGLRMLSVPIDDISPEHAEYREAASDLLFEVAGEKEIDPRL
ncbi:AAA family ATPase [Saccharibacillus qingshengii]|uniref:AAA family ATPase n=1 Tax=Saccharibacillus qingshengii TaxID=1763540 RepID=UPI001FE27B40|nr:AAA family ATPase [Saccharibacillus qingshengii]